MTCDITTDLWMIAGGVAAIAVGCVVIVGAVAVFWKVLR